MSLPTFTQGSQFIRPLISVLLLALSFPALADWKLDLSRRESQLRGVELRKQPEAPKKTIFDYFFHGTQKAQEVVILNTAKGFVPSQIRVREGNKYRIHVVNVNEKSKNVSFVMDAFSEHHATFYGQIKTFEIYPKAEGIFEYQCPETSAEGKVIVMSTKSASPSMRRPASR